jgi:hypothetical protein
MSIHFAGSRRPALSPIARCLSRPFLRQADNDNYDHHGNALVDNPLLRATLEHFARHGLSAAAEARTRAQQASDGGDAASCHHWQSVSRMLDRRLAFAAPHRAG